MPLFHFSLSRIHSILMLPTYEINRTGRNRRVDSVNTMDSSEVRPQNKICGLFCYTFSILYMELVSDLIN